MTGVGVTRVPKVAVDSPEGLWFNPQPLQSMAMFTLAANHLNPTRLSLCVYGISKNTAVNTALTKLTEDDVGRTRGNSQQQSPVCSLSQHHKK